MDAVRGFFLLLVTLSLFSGKVQAGTVVRASENDVFLEFSLFEENGKFGLKNERGEVVIPASHEALGWSNGNFSVVQNVIGYRSNGLWGIIDINNNKITDAHYLSLYPGEGLILIAQKQSKFAFRSPFGCLTTNGKEVIPFLYDWLSVSNQRAIVMSRSANRFLYGLIDLTNKTIIPTEYRSIRSLGTLRYAVENFGKKTAIFSADGRQITEFEIDSISSYKKGYAVIFQDRYQGLIDREGEVKLQPTFREIIIRDDGTIATRKADTWLFLTGANQLIGEYEADSICCIAPGLLRIEMCGKTTLADNAFNACQFQRFSYLGDFENERAIFKDAGKAGVINADGTILIDPVYDELIMDGSFLRACKRVGGKNRWHLLDEAGNILSQKQYDTIGNFNGKFFPVMQRGFWGAVDSTGTEILHCVYDSLLQVLNHYVVVRFKGGYGVVDIQGNWIIPPKPYPFKLVNENRYIEKRDSLQLLYDFGGNMIYFSENPWDIRTDHILEHLPSGATWAIDMNGVIVSRSRLPDHAEEVYPISEGLLAIRKDNRYGFVDEEGRLRIANRYENIRPFSDSLAAAMLLGRWGFINHHDNIAIQPVYDEVGDFCNGRTIVKRDGVYGVIDKQGKTVIPLRYDTIHALPGNRFKVVQKGMSGLADALGRIIIQPRYSRLHDLNNGYVIVERDGKYGLLTLQGVSTIPLIYDDIRFDPCHNCFMAVKKMPWETMLMNH